jgi:hypothetical protein
MGPLRRRDEDRLGLRYGAVSPAAAALKDTAPVTDAAALALPHWPGVVPLVAAAGLLAVTWTASVLVATRRDSRGASLS